MSLEPTVEGVVSEAGGDAVGLMGGGEVDVLSGDMAGKVDGGFDGDICGVELDLAHNPSWQAYPSGHWEQAFPILYSSEPLKLPITA